MALYTFKGGVHPHDGKEFSKDMPIMELKPGKELVYLLSQHIGAPAKPCVAKGDRVLAGQKIAEAVLLILAFSKSGMLSCSAAAVRRPV